MDVVNRIKTLCKEREWTEYKLSKESGIAQSTLSNLMHRGNSPSIVTLQKICKAFNITIAEFFESDGREEDESLKRLMKIYRQMNDRQKEKLLTYAANLLTRSE